jgi:hypothetical protein
MKFLAYACALAAAVSVSALSQDRYVGPGQTYATIQAAIDDAVDGDKIFVLPGTYAEFALEGKRLTVLGSGSGQTVVAGASTIGPNAADDPVVVHGIGFSAVLTFSGPPTPSVGDPCQGGTVQTATGNVALWVRGVDTAASLVDVVVFGAFHGAWVSGATLIADGCVFAGRQSPTSGPFFPFPTASSGGTGLIGRCASISLRGCFSVGANGTGTINAPLGAVGFGGHGLEMVGGTLVAHESSFLGGSVHSSQSSFPYAYGTAGSGLHLSGTVGRVASHGAHAVLGGLASSTSTPVGGSHSVQFYSMLLCPAAYNIFWNPPLHYDCSPSSAVAGAPRQTFPRLAFTGASATWGSGEFAVDDLPPGAELVLFLQTTPSVAPLPLSSGFFGDLLIAPFALPVAFGVADAEGRFVLPVDFSLVPADFVEIGLFMQAGALDASTGLVLASNALGFVIR